MLSRILPSRRKKHVRDVHEKAKLEGSTPLSSTLPSASSGNNSNSVSPAMRSLSPASSTISNSNNISTNTNNNINARGSIQRFAPSHDDVGSKRGNSSSQHSSDEEDSDEDDELITRHGGIVSDDSFRGGRVHFFRQVPRFFLYLECFLAYTCMCLSQITLEAVMAPLRMFYRGFRLRDILTTFYVLCGIMSLYIVTPSDSRLYSSVYHIIRASSTIKLYVIFNILELADKLLSAFNTDVIETAWTLIQSRRKSRGGEGAVGMSSRTKGLDKLMQWAKRAPSAGGNSPSSSLQSHSGGGASTGSSGGGTSGGQQVLGRGGLIEVLIMLFIASIAVMLHTIVLLCHVATINVAVNSEGSSLIGLLISNNFVEVKSVVFKKNTPESLLNVVCQDAVEGVQHVIFIVAMIMQHMLTSDGPGSLEVGQIALIIFCEVAIDFLKHVFVARFNCIRLETYKSYLHICFLDVSLRRFLADMRLPVVTSYTSGKTDLVSAQHTHSLSHAHFIPNPAHRAAFVPFPYASLLIWASFPAMYAVLSNSIFTALLCFLALASIYNFLKTFTYAWAASHTYGIVRKDSSAVGLNAHFPSHHHYHQHQQLPPSTAVLASEMSPSASISQHTQQNQPLSSTMATPSNATPPISQQPNPPSNEVTNGNADGAANSSVPPPPAPHQNRALLYVVLDNFTQSLLNVDRFDLQAGKAKKK